MRAERGGSRTRSFVLPTNIIPHSNKENSGQSPLSRTYSGRRSRAVVTNAVGVVSRRHRAHTPRLPPAPVAQLNDNMAAPNSELERPAERRITLPRHLSRPNNYRPIDLRIVVAIDPLLDNIPLIYIQHSLAEVGPR